MSARLHLRDDCTGPELVEIVRQRARDLDVRVVDLVRQLTTTPPNRWLHQVARSRSPRTHTLASVRALLADPEPAPIEESRAKPGIDAPPQAVGGAEPGSRPVAGRSATATSELMDVTAGETAPARPAVPVAFRPAPAWARPIASGRDPCPRCGVRGDLGCRHQRPELAA